MSIHRVSTDPTASTLASAGHATPTDQAMLGAVRDDVRQTLRMGWVDPALDALSGHPAFFTAGWSATRPNVGRSFLALAKAIREEAASALRPLVGGRTLRDELHHSLTEEEMRRIDEVSLAAHLGMPKVQLVVHSLYRAARRERIPGTGREEPPARRGVPEWQRWMASQVIPEASKPLLEVSTRTLELSAPPSPLRLIARWPAALSTVWDTIRSAVDDHRWTEGMRQIRRMVLSGVGTLPHPVELQWTALKERGLFEEERIELMTALRGHDAAMAAQTMIASFVWLTMGGPEIGNEG